MSQSTLLGISSYFALFSIRLACFAETIKSGTKVIVMNYTHLMAGIFLAATGMFAGPLVAQTTTTTTTTTTITVNVDNLLGQLLGVTDYTPSRSEIAGDYVLFEDGGNRECDLSLSNQKSFGKYSAKAGVQCSGDMFMSKSWALMGEELVIKNHMGKISARLVYIGDDAWHGFSVGNGEEIILAR